jgi:hypothetical protein
VIRRTWRAPALALSLAILVLGAAAPANAQVPEEHCVVLLDDESGVTICGDTEEDARAAFEDETGLVIVDEPGSEGARNEDDLGPLVVYSLAQLYVDSNFGGSSYLFTRSTPCNGVTLSSVSNLGSVGLNDAVSSFLTYSTCEVRLYADINYGGTTYGYSTSQSSLGGYNDVASSARAR